MWEARDTARRRDGPSGLDFLLAPFLRLHGCRRALAPATKICNHHDVIETEAAVLLDAIRSSPEAPRQDVTGATVDVEAALGHEHHENPGAG